MSRLQLHFAGDELFARRFLRRFPGELLCVAEGGPAQRARGSKLTVVFCRVDDLAPEGPPPPPDGDVFYITFWRSLIYLGPLWLRGVAGCGRCLLSRVADSSYGPDRDATGAVIRTTGSARETPVLPPWALSVVENLVAEVLSGHARNTVPRAATSVYVVDTDTGTVAREWLVPDSSCSLCAIEAPDTWPLFGQDRGRAREPRDGYRGADAAELGDQLERIYVHPHIGMIKEVFTDVQSPFGTCSVEVRSNWGRSEVTIGRSDTYATSRSVAILEALERYAGLRRGPANGLVRAPYVDVADHAIDPRSLGVHPDECYRIPNYPFAPFSPNAETDWVRAYSFRSQQPILVPAWIAFYGYAPGSDRASICETSNGCALGSSLEEATMFGLYELVERDSFLMTWYRKLALPELSLASPPDASLPALLARAELFTGCTFRAFISTMEHGIPSVMLVAIANRTDGACISASSGAHADIVRAFKTALYELAGLVLRLQYAFPGRRASARAMLDDASLVMTIDDHPLVNALPEARERFSFLLDRQTDPVLFRDVCRPIVPPHSSIASKVMAVVSRVLDVGLDVIVVNQTSSELDAVGLTCVKVIVPGLVPMTFGHAFRRVNLERLIRGPQMYESGIRTVAEIGALPHPFP